MRERTFHPPMARLLWPDLSLSRQAVLILAGSWLVALAAQIEIPLQPVPITGQTFGVLLVGVLLGRKQGAASLLAYLAQGAMGLPVFAGGAGGIARLWGPTGGYLWGFVVAAFAVGWLSERGWDRRFLTAALAMLVGNVVIYALGVGWLTRFVGWETALKVGVWPFLVGDALKIAMAALALPWGWRLIGSREARV